MRRTSTMQSLLTAIPLVVHADTAYAAEGPFVPIDLGPGVANAMNNSGRVVGFNYVIGAFSWTLADGMIALGIAGSPTGVNASDQIIGSVGVGGGAHAFSWTPAGGMVELPALGGSSSAHAVSASGQVVDASFAGDLGLRPVLWQPIANLGGRTTLAGCNLKGVNLAGAYLKDGDLSDANLNDSNLARANLTDANLTRANLNGANLTNANLVGANLKGAHVKDVIWSNTICPDGTNSDDNGGTCKGHLR